MSDLEVIERRVVASLEEAGENDLQSLVNTVRRSASVDELKLVAEAIKAAYHHGLVLLARPSWEQPRTWTPLSAEETARSLDLEQHSFWSTEHGHWLSKNPRERLDIVLTDQGIKAAIQILEEGGWTG